MEKENQFYSWLRKQVRPERLSDYYLAYSELDQLCQRRRVGVSHILEIESISSLEQIKNMTHHSIQKSAIDLYHRFLVETKPVVVKKSDPVKKEVLPAKNEAKRAVFDHSKTFHQHREEYIAWMQAKQHGLRDIFSNLSLLETLTKYCEQKKIISKDLLMLDEFELQDVKRKLQKRPRFIEIDRKNKNRYQLALQMLILYRSGNEMSSLKSVHSHEQKAEEEKLQNLNQIQNQESDQGYERYRHILGTVFSDNGYQPGRFTFRRRFQNSYQLEYQEELPVDFEELERILKQIGITRDGRIYPKKINQQYQVTETIKKELKQLFEHGVSAVYIDALMLRHQKDLNEQLHIYDRNVLRQLLEEQVGQEYAVRIDYITPSRHTYENTDRDAETVMKQWYIPQPIQEIMREMWYVPEAQLRKVLNHSNRIVSAGRDLYFYAPNFPIDTNERLQIATEIKRQIEEQGYCLAAELLDAIEKKYPGKAIDFEKFSAIAVRNSLGCLLKDQFSFNGNVIHKRREYLTASRLYGQFACHHESMTMSELSELSDRLNLPINWESIYCYCVRISATEFVNRQSIPFSIDATDQVLEMICSDNYVPIRDVDLFMQFPNIGVPWNSYILESYLYNFSRKFQLIHTSFTKYGVYGAVVRRDSGISDYRELIVDVLSNTCEWNNGKEAIEYLVDHGYQQRRSYSDIGSVVRDAKILREQRMI